MGILFDGTQARILREGASDAGTIRPLPPGVLPVTFACFFNKRALTAQAALFSVGDKDVNNTHVKLTVTTTGAVELRTNELNPAVSSTTIAAGRWGHACGIQAASTDKRAFLNGGGKGTQATAQAPAAASDRIIVGREADTGGALPWDGLIAWPAVWNVALTDVEVAMLANGVKPTLIRPGNLVFFIPEPDPFMYRGQGLESGMAVDAQPFADYWRFNTTAPVPLYTQDIPPQIASLTPTQNPLGVRVGLAVTQIVGSDASGVSSEVAALVAAITGTDTEGADTEATALTAALTGADASGTQVEATALTAQLLGTDTSGTQTENAIIVLTGTDAMGTSSEVGALVAQLTGTDASGVNTESGVETFLATVTDQLGTGAQTAVLAATYVVTDANGTATEVGVLTYLATVTDQLGTDVENAILTYLASVSDSGGGTDNSALTATYSVADSGSGTDTGNASANYPVSDSSLGTDNATLIAAITGADSSSAGSENAVLTTSLVGTDTSGTMGDVASLVAVYLVTDALGVITEDSVLTAALSVSDSSGTGNEFGDVPSAGDQTRTGSDSLGLATETGTLAAAYTVTDAVGDLEDASLIASYTVTDSNSSLDLATLAAVLTAADQAAFVEDATVRYLVTVFDQSGLIIEQAVLEEHTGVEATVDIHADVVEVPQGATITLSRVETGVTQDKISATIRKVKL